MSELRIVSDDDDTPWIEKKTPDGTWERVQASDDLPKFRVADLRKLNHSRVTEIAETIEHAQNKLAEEILASHASMAKSLTEALKPHFALKGNIATGTGPNLRPEPVAPAIPAARATAFDMPDLPSPAPDPTYELIAQIEEQNTILVEQRDDARKHAAATEKDAKGSRTLAWVAIGVTVAVGLAQIVLSIIELNA
ncbi:hypothetical protein [Brachybacterium sp. GU-2]|uniref:hypothetical protein n=1 Tax=Brachybacterium sp. GU-2 TaxID=3069708 RepID=UPI00280BBE1C|nr:hypothetical protein [Brachybacterium sp. GU-2]WME22126.1 hypothetical protein RBL05_11330 [Brachybacterium sp. GU-2]